MYLCVAIGSIVVYEVVQIINTVAAAWSQSGHRLLKLAPSSFHWIRHFRFA